MGRRWVKKTTDVCELIQLSRKQKAQAEDQGYVPGAHEKIDSQLGIRCYKIKTLTDQTKPSQLTSGKVISTGTPSYD